jgi:hypothetical protein
MAPIWTILALWVCGNLCQNASTNAVVNLPDLGHVKGRIVQTMGNLDHQKKSYFNFRNIPFAQSVSGENRFSVNNICKLQPFSQHVFLMFF